MAAASVVWNKRARTFNCFYYCSILYLRRFVALYTALKLTDADEMFWYPPATFSGLEKVGQRRKVVQVLLLRPVYVWSSSTITISVS